MPTKKKSDPAALNVEVRPAEGGFRAYLDVNGQAVPSDGDPWPTAEECRDWVAASMHPSTNVTIKE